MSGSLLLFLLVALAVITVLRVRRRLAVLAEQIRQLRAHALEPVAYTPSTHHALDAPLATVTREAEALGFTVIGDYAERSATVEGPRPQRWIADASGTTFGYLAPFAVDGAQHIIVVLMSHELDRQTITSRQPPSSSLARPPFVDTQRVPVATSLTETIAKHRKRIAGGDEERAFIPAKTFAQIEAELDRMRGKVTAWRRSQPVDELLEADLKALLGPQYAKLNGPLRRRLI